MKVRTTRMALLLAAGLFSLAAALNSSVLSAQTGVPYPDASTPRPVDLGPLVAQAGSTPISVTVALRLRSPNEAESLLKALHTPGNSQFHQFLSPAEFATRFGPAEGDVAKVISHLATYNLKAERSSTTTLRVTGSPANLERAFAVSLHSYRVPAHGKTRAYTFRAPVGHPTIPPEMTGSVAAIAGLDTHPTFRPLHMAGPQALRMAAPRSAAKAATGNQPGFLTVADFANLYDVQPLYRRGVTGHGRTLGIVTLASFTPSDAFAYWSAVGLTVNPGRIRIVDVDGGPGAPSDESGSIETTLDVEQSGGVAPGAKIIVYQAPNTNQGFVDAFATAIDSNSADSISVSWGLWEWLQNLENSPVTDPITGQTVGSLQAFHELFVRAAIQGQSLFSASGDNGAYELNGDFGCNTETTPACNITLSVNSPASDSAITAAGGTTLPGLQEYCLNSACTPPFYPINIPRERVWGWDYLNGLCAALGAPDPIACGTFPGGTGGGVSVFFPKPEYQDSIPGTRHSEQHQNFVYDGTLYFHLPGNYVGRNVPDISFNADPQTGYQIYYTSDQYGFGEYIFAGGTSFVSPQLNGVTALLGQSVHSRIGLLNFPLYDLAHGLKGYKGSHPSLHEIKDGDNWFYSGHTGYSPATGLGTLDVANFAGYLQSLAD
jgi:kumamolisin